MIDRKRQNQPGFYEHVQAGHRELNNNIELKVLSTYRTICQITEATYIQSMQRQMEQ